jgi:hypothetical protein
MFFGLLLYIRTILFLTKWESLSSKLIFLGPNIGSIPHWILCVFAVSDSSHYKRMLFFSYKRLLLMAFVK